MLLAKGAALFRAASFARRINNKSLQPVRNSHACYYRSVSEPPKFLIWIGDGVMAFAWWWFLWHMWVDTGHFLGEWDYPEPKDWTDEELGIPPIE